MNLYIHIEILKREFQSKLLIGMESASRGIKVYMGRLEPYILRDFFVPGIVMQKSLTPTPNRLKELRAYKKKKFIVTSLDEEIGLVNLNYRQWMKLRFSNTSVNLSDKIFTWGKFDYDNLTKKFKKFKNKFVLSGNPRVDFWRRDMKSLFKKNKISYKNYILISCNFFLLTKKEFAKKSKFLKKTNYLKRGYTMSKFRKRMKDSARMFEEFSNLIKVLSQETKLKIIVRPHPIDDLNKYDFLSKFKNVKVTNAGSISEWIPNAKLVVHSGCTGGLEASMRGRPTVSYIPFNSSHGHPFCDRFSIKAKSQKKCISIINEICGNSIKIKKPNLKNLKFRAHNLLSPQPGYKIIADEFCRLIKEKKAYYNNNDFYLNLRFKLRDLRSRIFNLKYGNIKFPFFDKNQTLKTFEIFKNLDPKFNNLKLNFIKKEIIQIEKIVI